MNVPVSLLVAGMGGLLVWAGITDPDGGLTGVIGRTLRGEAQPAAAPAATAADLASLAPAFYSGGGSATPTAGIAGGIMSISTGNTARRWPGVGSVQAHVKQAAEIIGSRFAVSTIYGFGARDGKSDHPLGLALDFMTNSKTQGDQIAAYVQANAIALKVTYIIWWQRIWSVSRAAEGWRAMADRGGITANHKDHVHVSFSPVSVTGGVISI